MGSGMKLMPAFKHNLPHFVMSIPVHTVPQNEILFNRSQPRIEHCIFIIVFKVYQIFVSGDVNVNEGTGSVILPACLSASLVLN